MTLSTNNIITFSDIEDRVINYVVATSNNILSVNVPESCKPGFTQELAQFKHAASKAGTIIFTETSSSNTISSTVAITTLRSAFSNLASQYGIGQNTVVSINNALLLCSLISIFLESALKYLGGENGEGAIVSFSSITQQDPLITATDGNLSETQIKNALSGFINSLTRTNKAITTKYTYTLTSSCSCSSSSFFIAYLKI